MHTMPLRFQKGDIAVIVSVAVLALLVFTLFLPKEDVPAGYAQIYKNGELIKTVSLTSDQELTVTGMYTNTITVQDGKIAVTQSNCPGGDCVRCGWMDRSGRSLVCLPNGLEIRVTSDGGVDFVVG